MLTRESSLLGFVTLLSPDRRNAGSVMKVAGVAVLALVPYLIWTLYVNHVFPASVSGARLSVGIPLTGMGEHFWSTIQAFPTGSKVSLLFELAAPLSLCVQAVYLITRPKPGAATWRMGIGFAVLLFFLSGPVFAEQIAYCRTVLPLTIAFNVLLMGEEQRHFTTWFVAGNIGLAWSALHMVGEMLGAF